MQNKTMKRYMAALVAAVLTVAITVTLPLTSLADTLSEDNGTIQPREQYDGNSASNVINKGTVGENLSPASISANEGTVEKNYGTVRENYNRISENYNSVNKNLDTGYVGNALGGVVTTNYGTVGGNNGTVENNYTYYTGSMIKGTVAAGVSVTNQYYEVKVPDVENGAAALSDFIHNTQAVPGSDLTFLKSTGTGTITFTANDDYEIVGDTVDNCQGTGFVYSVAQSNGVFTVTLSSVTDAITITPQALNLVIQAIQQQNPDVPDNVIIRVAPSVQISEDDTRSNRAATETAPATGNVITAAQISEMIESALAANPTETVLDVDLGNDPSLTADSLIALCEKNNVAKRCHFTHNGMKFVLFVPVVDPTSATYQQCKALLDAEPGKQAGPIRLSQLFAPVGFSLSGE